MSNPVETMRVVKLPCGSSMSLMLKPMFVPKARARLPGDITEHARTRAVVELAVREARCARDTLR